LASAWARIVFTAADITQGDALILVDKEDGQVDAVISYLVWFSLRLP